MARIAIDARMIGPAIHGGIGRYAYELIVGLLNSEEFKHDLFILMDKDTDVPNFNTDKKLNIVRTKSKFVSLKEQYELYEITELYKIDLLHATSFVAPAFRRAKLIITIHDLIHLIRPEDYSIFHKIYYKTIVKNHIDKCNKILTDSEASKKDILRFYDVDSSKISVIPLGISSKFTSGTISKEIAKKYQLPNEYALYIGSNKPHKNLKTVIDAFENIPERIPLIIGGVYKSEFKPKRKNIIFLGKIIDSDLPDIYKGCKIFVYPSLIEGFGLNPLEAMASGKPVITSNTTSIPEVVGDAALLINPESKTELSNAVFKLWDNEEMLKSLSEKAIRQASLFTWQKTVAKTILEYESCLK